jgi:hypothetical protein
MKRLRLETLQSEVTAARRVLVRQSTWVFT